MRLHPAAAAPRSLWLEQALACAPAAPAVLREPIACDVCIIGGGFAGLWTAVAILDAAPGTRVVLLEADICGGGASGRNTGQALSWWTKLATLARHAGPDEALRLAHASVAAIGEIETFCRREAIDAEFRRSGWLWLASSRAQVNAWAGVVAGCAQLGEQPFEELGVDEIQRRTGSRAWLAGLLDPSAAVVQPAKLARGLRAAAIRRGATVYEHTPVLRIDERRTLHTPFGRVTAEGAVVLTLGAWAAGIRRFRRQVVPIASDVLATEPIGARLDESGWRGGEAVTSARLTLRYMRRTADGRLLFGRAGTHLATAGRITPRFAAGPGARADGAAEVAALVPAAAGARVTHRWSGPVDRTPDGLPQFGRLMHGDTEILFGHGYSGNGVAPSLLGARVLAGLALGRHDQWTGCALARARPGAFPPEPVRSAGGHLVRRAVQRLEDRRDQGRRVDAPTRRLARLAPHGLADVAER